MLLAPFLGIRKIFGLNMCIVKTVGVRLLGVRPSLLYIGKEETIVSLKVILKYIVPSPFLKTTLIKKKLDGGSFVSMQVCTCPLP